MFLYLKYNKNSCANAKNFVTCGHPSTDGQLTAHSSQLTAHSSQLTAHSSHNISYLPNILAPLGGWGLYLPNILAPLGGWGLSLPNILAPFGSWGLITIAPFGGLGAFNY
jgi:hypothetical protein